MPDRDPTQIETDLCARLDGIAGEGALALAVSGGSDSMALMYAVAARQRSEVAPNRPITVLTVDHRLRREAAVEASAVRQQAIALGFDHVTLPWEGEKPASGVSAAARAARYALMTDWCRDNQVDRLILAHTIEDQSETVMMRLMRGSGVDGLSAMAPETRLNGVVLVRPFLDIARGDLQAYLKRLGRTWFDDPSNENEAYERVRVRRVLSDLGSLGLTPENLATSARRLQRVRSVLEGLTNDALRRHVEVFQAGYCRVSASLFADEAEEIALRVLSRCLVAVGGLDYPPRQTALEDLGGALRCGAAKTRTLGGCAIAPLAGGVEIVREAGRIETAPVPLKMGEPCLWDRRFWVGCDAPRHRAHHNSAIEVRPLLADGWDQVKENVQPCRRRLREGLVSFWQGGEVVAVPHIAYRNELFDEEVAFSAEFCNFALLEAASNEVL